jgi:hypothetical protein
MQVLGIGPKHVMTGGVRDGRGQLQSNGIAKSRATNSWHDANAPFARCRRVVACDFAIHDDPERGSFISRYLPTVCNGADSIRQFIPEIHYVPRIIEYDDVLSRMLAQRMRCQYFNSGAFGFDPDVTMHFAGWIGADDPTIRPAALERAQKIPPPIEPNLARMATSAWQEFLPGIPAWIMPKSSWAYELDFGSKAWLPGALNLAGIDSRLLEGRTNAPAIEFSPEEAGLLTPLLQTLLQNLFGSDFALAFPGRPVTCTVHHHKQLWWMSSEAEFIAKIERMGNRDISIQLDKT